MNKYFLYEQRALMNWDCGRALASDFSFCYTAPKCLGYLEGAKSVDRYFFSRASFGPKSYIISEPKSCETVHCKSRDVRIDKTVNFVTNEKGYILSPLDIARGVHKGPAPHKRQAYQWHRFKGHSSSKLSLPLKEVREIEDDYGIRLPLKKVDLCRNPYYGYWDEIVSKSWKDQSKRKHQWKNH